MKKTLIAIAVTVGLISCVSDRPTDAELNAFKVYHHMIYMVTTSEQAV